ncbi:MAG TPA: hypothetical protein VJ997_15475 [Longimicrobiales bacterium]|nr:hypothetical protein [Longimicrobiales bacterium]
MVALVACTGLLAACSEGSTPLDVSPSFARSANAPVHKVSGGGKVDFTIVGRPDSGMETYGFNASVDGNGDVKGEFQATFSSPDVTFHADVTCLAVDGNNAWLGVVVTQTHDEDAFPVGTPGVIRVQDNGEGNNATGPDQLGYWVLNGNAAACGAMRTDGVFGVLFPWIHGNAQVK